jgi:hypothetical protein
MKHTNIYGFIFLACICFMHVEVHTVESKKFFKIATIMSFVGLCRQIATEPSFTHAVGSSGQAFAQGVVTCSMTTTAGALTHYATAGNELGRIAGIMGATPFVPFVGGSFHDVVFPNSKGQFRFDQPAKTAGCYCGHLTSLIATHALLYE